MGAGNDGDAGPARRVKRREEIMFGKFLGFLCTRAIFC